MVNVLDSLLDEDLDTLARAGPNDELVSLPNPFLAGTELPPASKP